MAGGPCFFSLKQCTASCYSSPICGPKTRVTWDLFFSCSAAQPCTIFEKMYGGCCRNRTKFQRRWKSLFAVYLENTLFQDKFIHPF